MTPFVCMAYTLVTYEGKTGVPVFSDLDVPIPVTGYFCQRFKPEDAFAVIPDATIEGWYIGVGPDYDIGLIFTSKEDLLLFKLNA